MNWKEAYSNHSEENTGRGERGLGLRHARRPLRTVQGTNGHVQRGEIVVLPLGFRRHGRDREEAVWRAGCEEVSPRLIETSVRSDIARLVRTHSAKRII